MEIKVNVVSDSEHEVEINLTYEEIKSDIENAYKEERKNLSLPGFRKGKVPLPILKKQYGEAIEYKASESIAQKKFWEAVDQENLNPISTPSLTDIDFVINEKLGFKVKYEIKPSLELKDYKGIEIEKPIFNVKEEDIEKEVDYLLKQNSTFEEAGTVESNDYIVTVDLQRVDENNTPIVGSRSENMRIDLNDERVSANIKEKAVNKKVGESFTFTFTDEHKHGEEVHKEEFIYTAEIKKVEKIAYPEVTEDLCKKLSKDKATTLDELKNLIKGNFENYYSSQSENIFTNSLLAKVVENNDFTPPPGYVELLLDRLVNAEKEQAKQRRTQNFNENTVREELKTRAEWNAKWQIILENISEKENLKVEDSEIEELAKKEAEKTGISVEKLKKFYNDSNRKSSLLEEKVMKFLKENNTVKEIDAEEKMKESKEGK
ncbi:MAG: trigger factor [Ignavibacteria bacterium]